jgi:hypothetical protein
MSKVGLKATMDSGEEPLLQIARAALAAYDLPPPLEVRPIRFVNNAVLAVVADGALRLALQRNSDSERPTSRSSLTSRSGWPRYNAA